MAIKENKDIKELMELLNRNSTQKRGMTAYQIVILVFQLLSTLAFTVLKLCDVIGWSWAWIFAPLWGPAAAGVALLIVFLLIWAIATAIAN